ncbi:MAG TPA: hypothetical protein ENJ80_14550 [Gammaproteobacteria bacterium]|nr:hypothetical protein [Gammaproteobacteria bacterium]
MAGGHPLARPPGFIRTSQGFRNVHAYPTLLLHLTLAGVCVPVTYRKTWQDGFGARGWKLDVSIADPAIIASTRETGGRIPTSVLVHDLLDHFFSGFDISGHRAEAMALVQLGKRTGSDIHRDCLQMVDEDLLHGRVNRESLADFLPQAWLAAIPFARHMEGRELIRALRKQFGEEELRQRLARRLLELGERGISHAQDSWRLLGLDPARNREIGLAVQRVLVQVDQQVEQAGIEQLSATFIISNEQCALQLRHVDGATALAPRYSSRVA